MSELIPGVALIWKLISKIPSWTGERRQQYFSEVIEPCFRALEQVQETYNKLNLDCRNQIVDLSVVVQEAGQLGHSSTLSIRQKSHLQKIKREFIRKRQQDEYLRDGLRHDARQIFNSINWTEERRFLAAVAYYFLTSRRIVPRDQDLDRDIEGIMTYGGDRRWDTPSTALYFEIENEVDLDKLLEILDSARNALNQRFVYVREHFNRIQNNVLLHT